MHGSCIRSIILRSLLGSDAPHCIRGRFLQSKIKHKIRKVNFAHFNTFYIKICTFSDKTYVVELSERYFKYDVPTMVQSCTVVDCESY